MQVSYALLNSRVDNQLAFSLAKGELVVLLMSHQSKIRFSSITGLLVLSCGLSHSPALAQTFATSPVQVAFPVRIDILSESQLDNFEQTDRNRIKPYLHSLPWLYDAGWIEARQQELFLHFFAKLKHETAPPFVEKDNLLEWRAARHRKAYTTQLVDGQIQVSDKTAAWELIVEDLKVCVPLLNSDAPLTQRKAAFAIAAADMPIIGAILGDAHAARLTYEGFLLPFLDLAHPEPGLWPSQGQILLDSYAWMLRDASEDKVGDLSRMMIRYGEEWYDKHYDQEIADITRYAYGDYFKAHGQPLRAISYWKAIKAPNLLEGAKTLYQQTEKEQKSLHIPLP